MEYFSLIREKYELKSLLQEEKKKNRQLEVDKLNLQEKLKKEEEFYKVSLTLATLSRQSIKVSGSSPVVGPGKVQAFKPDPTTTTRNNVPNLINPIKIIRKTKKHGKNKKDKRKCLCGKRFGTILDRDRHVYKNVRGRIQCNVIGCNESFSDPRDARSHKLKAHDGHQLFVCGFCKQFFWTQYDKSNHKKFGRCDPVGISAVVKVETV